MTTSGAIKKTFVAYINGFRMWPRNVNVTATLGSLLDFSVEFPAVEQWDILPPRSHCVIFFTDPVTKKWRMLCEGEYIGYSKSRVSSGSRSRYLSFRGLHGTLATSTYASYAGILSAPADENVAVMAQGRRITPTKNSKIDVFSLDQLIDGITDSGRVSALFNNLIRSVLLQLPVEGFYLFYRKLMQKTFAFRDDQATAVLRVARFKQITKLMASVKANDNKTLLAILREFESTVMYQHYPLLCPPIYGSVSQGAGSATINPAATTARIPEIVFSPALYAVVPPACNVFFEDQMTTQNSQRNFVSEPTRVVLQIQSGQIPIPNIYMSNAIDSAVDVRQITNTDNYVGQDPGKIVFGINLSQEELLRGVVPQNRYLNFEMLGREAAKTAAKQENAPKQLTPEQYSLYCTLATQHHFSLARGEHRPGSIVCAFHPYAVAGVPALIEDRGGSFHCIIQSVTHTLASDSPPFTTLNVTHVRAAQAIEGQNSTPPNPSWLNEYYLPHRIAGQISPDEESGSGGTWGKLLGPNAWEEKDGTFRSAMVTDQEIIDDLNAGTPNQFNATLDGTSIRADEQVNMDRLAAKVLPVPQYDDELNYLKKSTNTVADHLRRQTDVPMAMMRFNYRPGTSLSDYIKFHGLSSNIESWVDRVSADRLPDALADIGEGDGHPLFGSPVRMKYSTSGASADEAKVQPDQNIYGIYELIPDPGTGRKISRIRQQAARTIQRALNQIITRG